MSVAEYVNGARLCHSNGLNESSLALLLLAVAATARKRYPKGKYTDRKAFETFLLDEMKAGNFFGPHCQTGVSMMWKGLETTLEAILYDLRCCLTHEAVLHPQVVYDPVQDPKIFVLRIDQQGRLVFQDSLLECMIKCVHNVRENAGELSPMPFTKTQAGTLKTASRKYRIIISESVGLPLP